MKYANRLKKYRELAKISQNSLAEKIGISDSALQNYEYGERDLPGKVIIKLCDFFKITSDELLGLYHYEIVGIGNEKESLSMVDVPLLRNKSADLFLSAPTSDETCLVPHSIHQEYPKAYLVEVTDASLNRKVPQGSYALINPTDKVEDNKPYLISLNHAPVTIMRIQQLRNGFKLLPDSTDPTFATKLINLNDPRSETLTIIGQVIWFTVPFGFEI